ncbi:MAG: methionine--tRNA ligase [Candidatus Methylarchaceae archaeon HK01B]|nr:methionine--tRNA ligase [Candidatus Methylarchaceae archaeon HK01M]MCP8318853.1 methionine--tRNA ligase [Candidatus Methylarchaceae archaeon HK01B]
MTKWIVTSAWPYSSDIPHLGNLIGSVLSADVMARYFRMKGHSVIFVSGSDEHGTPVEIEAIRHKVPVKEFADANHLRINRLFEEWNISYDNYTRTESPVHVNFVINHFKEIYENGFIFEEEEPMHYCPKDDKILPDRFVEGICPNCGATNARGDQCDSCGKPLDAVKLIDAHCAICNGPTEIRMTKQWYFDLPKLNKRVKQYILNNKELSENAASFSLSLIEEGLKPRSLTRDTQWGIPAPFPGAKGKTIYVWMEAVLGYVSAVIEYFENKGEKDKWQEYWLDPATKSSFFIGKDNIPFHTIIFPSLILASKKDYTLPTVVSATEFLLFNGKKFSKSRRIGIWIDEALEILPVDYWRYSLLSIRPESGDVNFTYETLEEKVNSELNDKIGNFVNRTLSAIKRFMGGKITERPKLSQQGEGMVQQISVRHDKVGELYEKFRIQRAVKLTLDQAEEGNAYLNATEPWKTFKFDPEKAYESLYVIARISKALAVELYPIIPSTAEKIWTFLGLNSKLEDADWSEAKADFDYPLKIGKFHPLFMKIKKKEIIKKLKEIREKEG